jgi:hypothetical protein
MNKVDDKPSDKKNPKASTGVPALGSTHAERDPNVASEFFANRNAKGTLKSIVLRGLKYKTSKRIVVDPEDLACIPLARVPSDVRIYFPERFEERLCVRAIQNTQPSNTEVVCVWRGENPRHVQFADVFATDLRKGRIAGMEVKILVRHDDDEWITIAFTTNVEGRTFREVFTAIRERNEMWYTLLFVDEDLEQQLK